MKTNQLQVSFKAAQANFDQLCNAVISNRESIIIKRPGGANVALLAANELSALMETLYLLESPRNAARLVAAMKRAKRR